MKQNDIDITEMPKGARITVIALRWLTLAGFTAFLLGAVCELFGAGHPHIGGNICFPLSDPSAVVVRRNGEIVVALSYYSRIQVYDSGGNFKFGYFVNSYGGNLSLRIDHGGNLIVIPTRNKSVYMYDESGRLQSSILKAQFDPQALDDLPFVDQEGRRYYIVGQLWNPRIIREDGRDERNTVIQTPLPLRPFVGPLPCWALALSAFIIQRLVIRWFRRAGNTLPPGRADRACDHVDLRRKGDDRLRPGSTVWRPNKAAQ
jgi:hypothetical protein